MVNGKKDRVIETDMKSSLWTKVMRNRKERQCVDKDDSMTDMTDLKQVIHFLAIMKFTLYYS